MEASFDEALGQRVASLMPLLGRRLGYVQELRKLQRILFVLAVFFAIISGLVWCRVINITSDGGRLLMGDFCVTILVMLFIVMVASRWYKLEIRKINAELVRTTHS